MKPFDYSKLKRLREEKGITQKKMSALLHMTQSNYNKLENGKKKSDSLQTIAKLAEALEMTEDRLTGILAGDVNIESAGIKTSELLQVQKLLSKPLRKDEFVLFATPVLEIEKHAFKNFYPGLNLSSADDDDPMIVFSFAHEMNIITSEFVEIGFEHGKKKLKTISIWLGDKQLGVIADFYTNLVDELIHRLLISRAVLIENEDGINGYFDTYMKVVFIATNAINKSSDFKNARFTNIKFMSQEEVKKSENETSQALQGGTHSNSNE